MNFLKHEASLAGRPLNLTPVEFKLLGVLVKEPGRVFSRAELIEKAWAMILRALTAPSMFIS